MTLLAIWIIASLLIYLTITWIAVWGWRRNVVPRSGAELPIHIFIPAHNEAECIGNLLDDLTKQEFDAAAFTVTVVDDRSTDRTSEIVAHYHDRLPIRILHIEKLPEGVHGKLYAMYLATADLTDGSVLMVDADCRVSPRWLAAMTNDSGPGGAVGPVFEVSERPSLWREMLSIDQGAITFAAMGLIARGYPMTASTANMLIPVHAIRNGLWNVVGTDGTGEDGRILQTQFAVHKPMRAVLTADSAVITPLAPTYRDIAAARRRWYQDTLTYPLRVQLVLLVIGVGLGGLWFAMPALLFLPSLRIVAAVTLLIKLLSDLVPHFLIRPLYPLFQLRAMPLWSPLQPWLLFSYLWMPKRRQKRRRGFADQDNR